MSDPYVPDDTKMYQLGPLHMEQVRELEVLLREGALIPVQPLARFASERRDGIFNKIVCEGDLIWGHTRLEPTKDFDYFVVEVPVDAPEEADDEG